MLITAANFSQHMENSTKTIQFCVYKIPCTFHSAVAKIILKTDERCRKYGILTVATSLSDYPEEAVLGEETEERTEEDDEEARITQIEDTPGEGLNSSNDTSCNSNLSELVSYTSHNPVSERFYSASRRNQSVWGMTRINVY